MNVTAAIPDDFSWLGSRCGYTPGDDFRAIKATDATGRIRGMVGFDSWWPNAAHMHVALDSATACRALLQPAFRYVFGIAAKALAIGVVPAHNAKSLRFAKSVGFSETHRIRDGWEQGDDMVVLELRREDCRFFRGDA